MDSIPWTPLVFLGGLLVSGVVLLVNQGRRQDRTEMKVTMIDGTLNEVKGDVKLMSNHVQEIRITLAEMKGSKSEAKPDAPRA